MGELKTYKKRAMKFKLVLEEDPNVPRAKFNRSNHISEFMKKYYYDETEILIREEFYLLLLNNANICIGAISISQGGITGTVVDIRLLAKYALESLATAVVLVHNHPSGNCRPSQSDLTITKKIKSGLQMLDIRLLDHVILTRDSYYSFADECDL
jgi:DNA repair protein RadC